MPSINNQIAGLPLCFTDNADPQFRVFTKTFLQNANIINIIPGKPFFTGGALRTEKFEELQKLVENNSKKNNTGLWKDKKNASSMNKDYYKQDDPHIKESELRERDLRFYSFMTDFVEYRRILNVLLNEIGTKLAGFSLNHNIDKYFDLSNVFSSGLHFYCEGSSTASESATSEISESMLASGTKGISDKAKELAFLTGKSGRGAEVTGVEGEDPNKGMLEGLLTSVGSTAQSLASGMAGIASDNLSSVASAENLVYPKVWRESTFDKTYNLNFKFISPYGDPRSIFEYVYVPFLMLFAFALPRQVKPMSYKSPMLCRLDSPGFLSCDIGMVNNFTFVRGGSEGLWASNGLPLCIDVNMTIVDMYPTMALASDIGLLRQNIGLSGFLNNMCGLNVMSAHVAANLKASIAAKTSIFAGIDDSASMIGKNTIENMLERFID